MGVTFDFTRKRWKNIDLGEEITKLIDEMKSNEIEMRPSVDQIFERILDYCKRKVYSDSIDIISFLSENKTFIQPPFYEDLFTIKQFI